MKKIYLALIFAGLSLTTYAATTASSAPMKPVTSGTKAAIKPAASAAKVKASNGVIVNVPCDDGSPCAVISDTSKRVLDVVNKGVPPSQTMSLIQAVILPQFDFTLMTKYAMGNNWKLATPEQQAQLVDLFKQLLVYTYSSALSKFKDASITITKSSVEDKKAAVISEVILPNSGTNTQPVLVEYDLAKSPATAPWRAYDIKIENASLVTTYRNQFNDVVQSSKVEGLIKQLQTKVNSLKTKSST